MKEPNNNNPPNMLEFLNRVNDYLEELIEANRELLGILNEYQKVLVKGDTDEIEKSTPALDRHAGKIRMIDEKRRAYIDEFFLSRGWDGPRNFSAISNNVSEIGVTDEEGAAFERTASSRMSLIEVLAEVDATNSLNITLIGQSMSFAEVSLKALLGFQTETTTYGPSIECDDGPSLLDAQA
jgi:hypothetical protein